MKNVSGQPADLSRHGAADRQLAHEICFNVDDKMLPPWRRAVVKLRDLETCSKKSLRARQSTRQHFTRVQACSLHRQNKAVDDVETVAHQAGSLPSKETVVQSLKTVTWYPRPQQRARNHRLACAKRSRKVVLIERKAAGWAVMDADTRPSDSTAGVGKGAKGDHKSAYSATIPCKHHAQGTRGDKCRVYRKGSDSKPGGKGGKGKKANNESGRCKKCGKITNPPHWAKSCPEACSSAQVVLTSLPVSSSSEVAPPGLPAPVLVSRWIFHICPSDKTRDTRKVRCLCGSSKISCVRCA